jgi:Fe-S cluster biogenesis protein NfuA
MPGADDVHATGERVEALLADLGRLADASAVAAAEDLVRALAGLYGAALDRVMEILTETDAAEALHRLTADDLVSGLLLVHDLHPLTTAERVRQALDGVRPSLGGDDVELLGVTDGVVRLRLVGAGRGCGAATVNETLERAVTAVAPEVSAVEVERTGPLVQIGPRPPGSVPGGYGR